MRIRSFDSMFALISAFAILLVAANGLSCASRSVNSMQNERPNEHTGDNVMAESMQDTIAVSEGIWGGNGIRLAAKSDSVEIEFACAAGELPKQLRTDKNGDFRVEGAYIRSGPGPSREDKPPKRLPVIYSGKVSGKSMSLTITMKDSGEMVGQFELEHGKNIRLQRCL